MTDFFATRTFGKLSDFSDKVGEGIESALSRADAMLNDISKAVCKVNKTVEDGLVIVLVDMPGVKKKDLVITLSDGNSGGTIFEARAKRDEADFEVTAHFKESVKHDEAIATLKDGVLKLTAPVRDDSPKTVTEVKVL